MPEQQTKTAAELAAEIKADHAKSVDAVKAIAEEALGKAQGGEAIVEGLKLKADEALTRMNELAEQMSTLDQKVARGGGGGQQERGKSLGSQLVESDSFKAFSESGFSRGQSADVRVKATLTTLTTDAAGSVGAGAETTRLPGVLTIPERRMTVRDLLTPGRMDNASIEYPQETGFTNNAAPVAEGAAKQSSDIKLAMKTASARVIAHWMKASRQALSDVSFLRSLIDQRLLYGLSYAEENQLLNGDGTGQNLAGLIPAATAYSASFTPSAATAIDTMRLAMLQAALAEFPATGHVMNPIDWARIELTKDAGGQYIIGVPQGAASPTLWKLPVVETQAITVDKFLTGAFKMGAQIFDQWDARVETGYVNDDFTKNLVTILAEERLALAIYRPEAFIYGDLGFV